MAENDIGYYTLPVILSFDGIEKSVNSKLGKAFGDIGKKGSKQVSDATVADLKKAEDAYGKLRNKAADSLGKVRVEEEKLAKARAGGKADQIVAAEERLNKARRDSKTATDAARRSYDDLKDSQNKLGDGTSRLGGNFGNLGELAGKAGSAMAAAGVVAAGAALAGIAALGGGVIIAGRELYNLGQAWDDVTDSIAARTGKLGPDLDKLKNSIKDLAPATASSIGDIGNVVGSVSQALRISGLELETVSKTILDLNRITGEDLNVRELGKVFRGFGVDAKSATPTLDALYRASAATGISVNELLSAVVAAGPAARTMGLDLSSTASLLATFNEAGVDGGTALKALSVAAKNLAKDGRDPATGLRETITELQGLIKAGRDVDAVNLAAKIFGGRGFQPLLDAIRSGALDAQSLDDALASGGVTIDEVARATADWSERWQQLKNTLSVALEPLASGVFNMINAKLDSLADWVTNNQSKVIGFFGAVVDWAFAAAQGVIGFVEGAIRTLSTVMSRLGPLLVEVGAKVARIPGFEELGKTMADLGLAATDSVAPLMGAADAVGSVGKKLDTAKGYADAYIERTKSATRFTEKLGDSLVEVSKSGDIVITAPTDEVKKSLKDLGISVKELPDGKFAVTADDAEAQKILDDYRAQAAGDPIELPIGADTTDLDRTLGRLREDIESGAPFRIPFTAPIPGGGMQRFASGGAGTGITGPEKGLTENSISAKRAIESNFPQIQTIGGYRPTDVTPFGTFNEHSSGQAIDVMIPNWSTPAGKAYGDQIAQWALANADALGTEWVIWQQKTYYPDGRVSAMGDRGNPTQNHYDHVHLKTKPNAVPSSMRRFGPSGSAPMTGGAGGPINTADPMSVPEPAAATMSGSIDTSRLYGSGPAMAGTAGVNDQGQAGYYAPDQEKILQAQQRVDDANEAIRQADAAVAQAKASQGELDYGASESQQLSAAESVRSAEYRAQKARREAADAATKLAETQRGDFTKAKDAGRSGSSGGGQLGGLGSIAGSFLQETFGFGSFLPALDNLWPLQMADTLIGAFMPSADSQGMSTSSAPFGIPDIAAPPMPAGNTHGMGGMPGPVQNITVDQSQNFNNSPVGWDPVQTQKVQQNNAFRAPRLPVGMGS